MKIICKAYSFALHVANPMSYEEAVKHEVWKQVIMDEISTIEKNKMWKLVNLPEGKKSVGLKWVYITKVHVDGSLLKHKACL